ncbi:MAG: acyl-CoA thioesterase [Crocinitomicaceae bacterium]|nr:acyl-CoA thioesterase [Crocinitomicaceae bacterium]
MEKFQVSVEVRWSDVDQNRHVRHSAYYDYGAHARIKFLESVGFDAHTLGKLNIGPILFKEQCNFLKELSPSGRITINVLKGEISEGSPKWVLYHEIFNEKGEKAAHIKAEGAWMDLKERKVALPPHELFEHFDSLEQGEDFVYQK